FNPIGAHPSAYIGELPLGVPGNLVPFITQTAIGMRPSLTIFGNDYPTSDGTCVRDYIHVVDLAEAHVAALKNLANVPDGKENYQVFNVGTGQGNTVLELVKTFEEVSGQPLHYKLGPRRSGDISAVYADATKVQRELGWNAKRSLREALTDAWRWQQSL
ncbi:MAG: GDP-mannose 4,6-dehydratase, partial [Saprospiraceae bacterium]|nr:GDP-mannose 4,6-dehydratase [Saprospiraceae bacterium]